MSTGNLPESLTQTMLVGIMLSREIGRRSGAGAEHADHGEGQVHDTYIYIYI